MIAGFAASQAPGWREKHDRSPDFREIQAGHREVYNRCSTAIDWHGPQPVIVDIVAKSGNIYYKNLVSQCQSVLVNNAG